MAGSASPVLEHEQPAPQRIISLAPHVTEILFAIGAGDKLVGVMAHSDYPPEAKLLPVVGDFSRLDMEAVIGLAPDLVIAWQGGNSAADLDRLRDFGLRVVLTGPGTLDELAELILTLGKLSGSEQGAQREYQHFQQTLRNLRQTYSGRTKVSVFYQFWNAPMMTVNRQHIISSVIELCGGQNVFADLGTIAAPISVEAVLKRNPQVILGSGLDESRPEWLDDWLQWSELAAVQQQNLFIVPPDLIQRHSPRILQGAEIICRDLAIARDR